MNKIRKKLLKARREMEARQKAIVVTIGKTAVKDIRGRSVNDSSRDLKNYLSTIYHLRFNRMTEETEFKKQNEPDASFTTITQRQLNSFCMDARQEGIDCWDRDVSRYVLSDKISEYHPFKQYMDELPEWDGVDRLEELARRVSGNSVWIMGFRRWMLALAAQWSGLTGVHANSLAPLLVSREQGRCKSTFCRMLMPEPLQRYYTDSFDLNSRGGAEQKLSAFGLINLDEFDKFSDSKMAVLKNLMQMSSLNLRQAHKSNYRLLPRIASFIGTSNQMDLLTDPTGSRRFLCVEVKDVIDCSNLDHGQLYAQLKAELAVGKRYWFTAEEEAEIMLNNKAFYKQSAEEDVFYGCFRPAREGEECVWLPGSEIFSRMKMHNAAAMQNTTFVKVSKALLAVGIKRKHTKKGNMYGVVEI